MAKGKEDKKILAPLYASSVCPKCEKKTIYYCPHPAVFCECGNCYYVKEWKLEDSMKD